MSVSILVVDDETDVAERSASSFGEHAVAHILGDKPVEAPDDLGDGAMIDGDDLAIILGIETRRELGRADQIAKHYR